MITVDWPTKIITVPIADMTLVGVDEYDLDATNLYRQLHDRQDDEEGMGFLRTFDRTKPKTIGGVTKPQVIDIINDYRIQFEDGQYIANVRGGDTNVLDVIVHNQVSARSFNSFGTVVVGGGSAVDVDAVAAAVWDRLLVDHTTPGTFGWLVQKLRRLSNAILGTNFS